MKSAPRGSQSIAPATTSALQGPRLEGAAPATKSVHKVLRLPRNLHFEVKALCLLRNLHSEARKALRLLRNLHLISRSEVHKVLRLPRNLRFKALSAAPVTESALRGSQSVAPATKSALQGPQSMAPATKTALQGSPNAASATKSALRGSQSAARATRQGPQSAAPARNLQTNHMFQSRDSLRFSRNQSASKITTMSKALRLPQNLYFEARKALGPMAKTSADATLILVNVLALTTILAFLLSFASFLSF